LHERAGIVLVDIVTPLQFNLHDELMQFMDRCKQPIEPAESAIYATAYKLAEDRDRQSLTFWVFPLEVGETMPIVPLALSNDRFLQLDLESTYTEARKASKL
jgi:hypothetical protein